MTPTVRLDPQNPLPELEAYLLLRRINYMFDLLNRYDLRKHDLTIPQFAILNHATADGVPLSEISAQMLCDNSNLTGIVDRLVSKGYIERQPNPQDRRVSLIRLTPAGAEKLRSIRPRHHMLVSRRMRRVGPEQVQQLRDLLQALYDGLQTSETEPDDDEQAQLLSEHAATR
jgi:DNA-binding MarR family transcriptional regulator